MSKRAVPSKRAQEREPGFEQAFEALEEIVSELEGGGQSLEESLAAFERGVKLVRLCRERLEAARVRLSELEAPDREGDGARERSLDLEGEA